MKYKSFFLNASLALVVSGMPFCTKAQDSEALPADSLESNEVVIPPMFEYPVAPEELPDLVSKTSWLMDHFWDPFDFKKATVVDQNALNHAFGVYAQSMPYADPEKVKTGTKNLINKIKGNPGLTYQFTKAAEENLYGPRADVWIDEIYIMFLDNLMSNKKIDKIKKARYEEQYRILKATAPGQPLPELEYTSLDGKIQKFKPVKKYTIIEFGNPECEDCQLSKFQLEISGAVKEYIEDGLLDVAFFIPEDDTGELLPQTASYPDTWIKGSVEDAFDSFDLRATPTMYVVDEKGNIIAKNVGVQTAIGIVEQMVKASR